MSVTTASVSEMCEQVRGVSYSKGDAIDHPKVGYVKLLRANNITAAGLTFDNAPYVPESKVSPKQYLRSGDIVIAASSGSLEVVGKAAEVRESLEKATFGAFCKVLRPNKKVNSRYLSHYFKTKEYRHKISSLAAGANINNLRNEHLNDLIVSVPDLDEQKRIAAILDKADAIRRKRQQALEQLDKLLQSTFLDLFGDPVTNPKGWEVKKIGDNLCKRITVGIVVKPASYYVDQGIPALRSLNIKTNEIISDRLVYISKENNEGKLSNTRVWEDDILLVRSGQPGKAAVVSSEFNGVNAIDILIVTPKRDGINPVFLCHYFNSPGGKRMVIGEQRGQIQKHLNVASLRIAPVPLPPLELQQKFAVIVEKIEQQKTKMRQQLTDHDTLFAALQQRAFKGEL